MRMGVRYDKKERRPFCRISEVLKRVKFGCTSLDESEIRFTKLLGTLTSFRHEGPHNFARFRIQALTQIEFPADCPVPELWPAHCVAVRRKGPCHLDCWGKLGH